MRKGGDERKRLVRIQLGHTPKSRRVIFPTEGPLFQTPNLQSASIARVLIFCLLRQESCLLTTRLVQWRANQRNSQCHSCQSHQSCHASQDMSFTSIILVFVYGCMMVCMSVCVWFVNVSNQCLHECVCVVCCV